MTESQIRTTAKLLEARDSMRALHGDDWQAKVEEFAPYIRARAKEDKTSLMAGAIRLAKQASADHRPHLSVMLLAVGCELTSENDPNPAMSACKNEDDCPTPMWCRGKDKCPKAQSELAAMPFSVAQDQEWPHLYHCRLCHWIGLDADDSPETAQETHDRFHSKQGSKCPPEHRNSGDGERAAPNPHDRLTPSRCQQCHGSDSKHHKTMKAKELIEALEAYDPDAEVSLTFWNGEGSEVAPVLMVCDNEATPSIYAEGWDGPSLNVQDHASDGAK